MAPSTGDPELARRVRAARRAKHLTLKEVVSRLQGAPEERDHRWLSGIETARRNTTPQEVAALARALGVSTDSLLFDDPAPVITDDESLMLFAFRHAAPAARRMLLASARQIAEEAGQYDAGEGPATDRPPPAPETSGAA